MNHNFHGLFSIRKNFQNCFKYSCGCYYSVLQKTGSLWMLKGKDLLPLYCAVYRYMFCFSGRA